MSTHVAVNPYVYSVAYVANNLLYCMQEIVKKSGLDPGRIAADWAVLERGLAKWLETEHLKAVTLEVYAPDTDALVDRWDIEIGYQWNGGTGAFWVDTDQIRYAILKQGHRPSTCAYRILADTKPDRPIVDGWSNTTYRSTEGFIRQSIGTTLDASGLGGRTIYYRKKPC